ncbi:MAG: NitT/TauT family transport system ATP-binding protein [Eubacteriales bacterium SKADARSKE-1]|nr:NitT/TauT family transport system ATP-binding protein [Eubacteriales bacterium SKADARSKE-1]
MLLSFNKVSKNFGEIKVLDNFSINFPKKGTVCLFGKSGIGKTTILNLIAGLLKPDFGYIEGLDTKKISFAFQDERLLLWNTVIENVSVVVNKKSNIDKKEIAKGWLSKVGLLEFCDKKPDELSGGMKQRLVLARALAFDGDIILLDEPFKGLDDASKNTLIDLINEITKDKLVVVVTHSTYEALSLSDTIYVLKGTPIEVVDKLDIDLPCCESYRYNSAFLEYQKKIDALYK